jgi:hypothetical protein
MSTYLPKKQLVGSKGTLVCRVVDPEPQPHLFALAETECISDPVPEPDLYPDQTLKEI